MEAKLVKSTEVSPQGIPLDLGPLIAPYQHHKQLSVRIEKMPQLSRLSAGRNNGDCTFSLKIEDVVGLIYLPPPGANGSLITLAVRVINLDDDYATTLALIDLPVPTDATAEDGKKRKLHVVKTEEDGEDDTQGEPAEPAALQSIHVKRTDAGNEPEVELSEPTFQWSVWDNDEKIETGRAQYFSAVHCEESAVDYCWQHLGYKPDKVSQH